MTIRMKTLAVAAAFASAVAAARGQHDDPHAQPHEHAAAPTDKRVGDPYPFAACPISGEQLGSMGEPVILLYEGREVRFCCDGCPEQFDKDKAAAFARLDERIIKDQAPLYPLKTSVVSGKDLPETPYDFVYGNRLVRLADEVERATFAHHAKEYLGNLDKAVIAAQDVHYPLTTCPVSGDEYGGDMGKPVDLVVAGRLIRLCCKGCKPDVEKDPAKFIALVDEARKSGKGGAKHDGKHHDDKRGGR